MKKIEKYQLLNLIEDVKGAMYHVFPLNLSKIFTSRFWATKNAVAEPIAILTDIMSSKFVETKSVKIIPIKNQPTQHNELSFFRMLCLLNQ